MPTDMKHKLWNWWAGRGNPHAKAIRHILDQRIDYSVYADPDTVSQCDQLYEDRWHSTRRAFSHGFWRNHFEIDNLLDSGILDGPILDFGCGTGNIDIELALRGYRVTGIDLSPKAIAIAEIYRADLPNDTRERLSFQQADIATYEPNELFDVCVMTHVLEHIEDPASVFAAIRRVMADGGRIWVSVPFADYFDHHSHLHHFYSADDVASFLAPYARVRQAIHDEVNNVLNVILEMPA